MWFKTLADSLEQLEAVDRRLRKTGDLGLVAERLASAGQRPVLRVQAVYRAMLRTAQVTGAGAVDRKVRLLAALLRRATATEAKYFVRILQGRLRLDVGDQTILVATAVAVLGDARRKAVVEHAYNVRSDLGGVWPAWLCREASAHQQKLRDTADLVIVGYLTGRGKRAALGIGSLLGAVYDPVHDRFRTVAKIGSGPSEQQWRELHRQLQRQAVRSRPRRVDSRVVPDVWVEPTYVIEVLADEVTRSPSHTCGQSGDAPGYALRFPRMLNGVRTDKAPEDATTEHEILELAGLQRKAVGSAHGARASRPRRGPLTRLTTPPQRRRVSQCLSPGVGRASSEHPVQGPSTHPSRGAGGPTTPRPNGRSQPFPPAARRGGRRGSRGLLQGKGRGRGEQGQQPALRQEG